MCAARVCRFPCSLCILTSCNDMSGDVMIQKSCFPVSEILQVEKKIMLRILSFLYAKKKKKKNQISHISFPPLKLILQLNRHINRHLKRPRKRPKLYALSSNSPSGKNQTRTCLAFLIDDCCLAPTT